MQKLLLAAARRTSTMSQIGKTLAVLFEKPARHRRPADRPHALSAAGACRRRRRRAWIGAAWPIGADRQAHRQQSAAGVLRRREGLTERERQEDAGHTLEFPDNKLLRSLGGPHAKHFARIEQKLNVGIDMRGNLVVDRGREPASAPAASCARCICGWWRAKASPWPKCDAENPLHRRSRRRMAPGAITTASSRAVRPRSPGAVPAYLDMMRQCPLVFGIGPAGTGKTYLAAAFAAHAATRSGSTA